MKLTDNIYLVGSSCMGLSPEGDCNVYAIASKQDIYLIDCGLEPSGLWLLNNMARDGLDLNELRGVLLTHVHPDHVGAVSAFRDLGIPILGCSESDKVLGQGIAGYYQLQEHLPPSGFRDFFCKVHLGKLDRVIAPGEQITIGTCTLEILPTPGHSPDSVCYLLRDGEKTHLFTGDTLFYPGHINYFAPPLSCPEAYRKTLQFLADLHPDGLYPGHALFTIDRAWQCTDQVRGFLNAGVLPPIKPYS